MQYSTEAETQEFRQNLGSNPMFVCDMDGNILQGYVLEDGSGVDPERLENSENQTIPFDYGPAELEDYVENNGVKKEIFAAKSMDVRLPTNLVKALNHFTEKGQPFQLTLLTSRSMKEALKILEISGVKNPELVTLVADSGATLQINGERNNARPLTDEEQRFFDSIDTEVASDDFQSALKNVVQKAGFDIAGMPSLYVEPKGIAKNIHYREILDHFGQKEGSELDTALTQFLQNRLQPLVKSGPQSNDKHVFGLLDGPATLEVKVKEINKGHGLEAITKAAVDADAKPSAVVFSGDDVCKKSGDHSGPGTDYFAMVAAERLSEEFGVPFYNMHTHHPEKNVLRGDRPDPDKNPENLPIEFDVPRIDLRVPTPVENGQLIAGVLGFDSSARRPAFGYAGSAPQHNSI